MSTILDDPLHFEAPSRTPVHPAAPLDPSTASRHHEVFFELESPGGYRRTVTGTIAYLDQQAQTYMVLAADGALMRVPLRDVKKMIEGAPTAAA